jgi:hypothetical protein
MAPRLKQITQREDKKARLWESLLIAYSAHYEPLLRNSRTSTPNCLDQTSAENGPQNTISMDRAASYVAGSRHKDNCHWFVNGQELDAQNGQSDKGEAPTLAARLKTLSRCMSVNKHKTRASEYLAEQKAEQATEKQAEQSNDNELAA